MYNIDERNNEFVHYNVKDKSRIQDLRGGKRVNLFKPLWPILFHFTQPLQLLIKIIIFTSTR